MSSGDAIRYRNYIQNSKFANLLTSTTVTQYIGDTKKFTEYKDYTYIVCEAYLYGENPHDVFNASVSHNEDIEHVRDKFDISTVPVCTAMLTKLLVDGKWAYIDCNKEFQGGIVLCEKPRNDTRSTVVLKVALHHSEYCPLKKQLYFNSLCYRLLYADRLTSGCQGRFKICVRWDRDARECIFLHVMLTKWNRMLTNQVGFWDSGEDHSMCLGTLLITFVDIKEWRPKQCNLSNPDHWLCASRPVSFAKRLVIVQMSM